MIWSGEMSSIKVFAKLTKNEFNENIYNPFLRGITMAVNPFIYLSMCTLFS